MNQLRIAGCTPGALEQAGKDILDRSLLWEVNKNNLWIKDKDKLVGIGGNIKQNKLTAGDNIEIIEEGEDVIGKNRKDTIRLKDNIEVHTCTISPGTEEDPILPWKGTIFLGELTNGNQVYLITKATQVGDENQALFGGQILVRMVTKDGKEVFAQYAITITSTGSWSLRGGSNFGPNICVCKAKYRDEWYYGIKIPSGDFQNVRIIDNPGAEGYHYSEEYFTDHFDLDKTEFWYNGWYDLPEPLIPPQPPTSELEIQVLTEGSSGGSSGGDSFSEIFTSSEPIQDIVNKIDNLPDLGEDAPPYKWVITGRILSLKDLELLASHIKNADKQIYLDLSNCTVANDARTWNVGIFRSCSSLRGLSIPQGVRQIISAEFLWCTHLRTLDLSPSAGTLYELGASSKWGTIMSLLSSTRIRFLIVPNSVNKLTNYFMGASDIKKLVFTHQDNESLSISDWTFQVHDSGGNLISTIPTGFHLYITESWWNNYLYNNFIKDNASQKWQWNNITFWTKEVVDSIVTYDPNWSKEQWQAFATEYDWSEEEVAHVRKYFGLSDWA